MDYAFSVEIENDETDGLMNPKSDFLILFI